MNHDDLMAFALCKQHFRTVGRFNSTVGDKKENSPITKPIDLLTCEQKQKLNAIRHRLNSIQREKAACQDLIESMQKLIETCKQPKEIHSILDDAVNQASHLADDVAEIQQTLHLFQISSTDDQSVLDLLKSYRQLDENFKDYKEISDSYQQIISRRIKSITEPTELAQIRDFITSIDQKTPFLSSLHDRLIQ